MTCTHASIYYHSGTGNSYRVAQWLAQTAEAHGLAARVESIHARSARRAPGGAAGQPPQAPPTDQPAAIDQAPTPAAQDTPAAPQELLVLAGPAHAFTASWSMLKFAVRLPRGRGAQAAVVVTRAGTKVGRRRLPGLEGTGGYLLAAILAAKGYRVRGTLGLDMPSNWTQLHPGLAPDSVADIIDHARPKAKEFLARVLIGRRAFGGLVALLLGLVLLPVSVAYLLVGRFLLAKIFFANPSCTGCGQCQRSCPVGAIRLVGWRRKRPYWSLTCQNCMRCMAYCPRRAVEAGWSWGVLLYYVTNVPAMWLLMNHLLPPAWPGNRWALWAVQYVYWLAAMAAAYGVFQLLLRIPPVNWLFTLTTPTHVFRRYHEPQTSLEELAGKTQEKPA